MVPTIALADLEKLEVAEPKLEDSARTLIYLILLLSVKDKASEVRFEPDLSGQSSIEPELFKLSYCCDGTFYDMVPPPHCLLKPIGRVFKKIAALRNPWCWLAKNVLGRKLTGTIHAEIADSVVEVVVAIEPAKQTDRVILKLIYPELTICS